MPILSSIGFNSAKSFGFTSPSGEPAPTVIGQAYGGGYYAGSISVTGNSIATHYLVVAPRSSGQTVNQWKNANTATPGADSSINGPQNTADMVADGSSTVYPCAHFCNNAVIGGFSDWYMPARNELEICYFNLKPTTDTNNTSWGSNPNAVPARASNYTSGNPARTSVALFQSGGAQAFGNAGYFYWSSTEASSTAAQLQYFINGSQFTGYVNKDYSSGVVRAVRRVAV